MNSMPLPSSSARSLALLMGIVPICATGNANATPTRHKLVSFFFLYIYNTQLHNIEM